MLRENQFHPSSFSGELQSMTIQTRIEDATKAPKAPVAARNQRCRSLDDGVAIVADDARDALTRKIEM